MPRLTCPPREQQISVFEHNDPSTSHRSTSQHQEPVDASDSEGSDRDSPNLDNSLRFEDDNGNDDEGSGSEGSEHSESEEDLTDGDEPSFDSLARNEGSDNDEDETPEDADRSLEASDAEHSFEGHADSVEPMLYTNGHDQLQPTPTQSHQRTSNYSHKSPRYYAQHSLPRQLSRNTDSNGSKHSPRRSVSHGYDRSFSSTTAIHLDEQVDPQIDDDDEKDDGCGIQSHVSEGFHQPLGERDVNRTTGPMPQNPYEKKGVVNNTRESTSGIGARTDSLEPEARKLSDAVSTLPDEFDYYKSSLPGRSPLSFSRAQEHNNNNHTNDSRHGSSVTRHSHKNSHSSRFGGEMLMPAPTPPNQNSFLYQDISRTTSGRPVFRNPSSVRAMQLSSPPPFSPSPLSNRNMTHHTLSRNGSATPSHSTPRRQHPYPKKEYPLVLLHCTVSPLAFPFSYPQHAIDKACPDRTRAATALFNEKLTDTVLERGILIPHPGEDYELLEERVLECLELCKPRVGACGHFRSASNPKDGKAQEAEHNDEEADKLKENEKPRCGDCDRHINPSMLREQQQALLRLWDIRVYAANGLMRSGAWSAAWKEMEKVDVEVGVWLPSDLRAKVEEYAAQTAIDKGGASEFNDPLAGRPTESINDIRLRGNANVGKRVPSAGNGEPASTATATGSRREKEKRKHHGDAVKNGTDVTGGQQTQRRSREDGVSDHQQPLSTLLKQYLMSFVPYPVPGIYRPRQFVLPVLVLLVAAFWTSFMSNTSAVRVASENQLPPLRPIMDTKADAAVSPGAQGVIVTHTVTATATAPTSVASPPSLEDKDTSPFSTFSAAECACDGGRDDGLEAALAKIRLSACEVPMEKMEGADEEAKPSVMTAVPKAVADKVLMSGAL
ncbi:MAG: hypothetical protein M1831_001001 [Alyxoria varia]|nr:MAG: hypothetical protein M1831_001001 [Alyxoria varia]